MVVGCDPREMGIPKLGSAMAQSCSANTSPQELATVLSTRQACGLAGFAHEPPLLPLPLRSPATSAQPRGNPKPRQLLFSLVFLFFLPLLPTSSEVQSRWQISTRTSLIGRQEPSPAVWAVISCFSTFSASLSFSLFSPFADGGLFFLSAISFKAIEGSHPPVPCSLVFSLRRGFTGPVVNGHFLRSMRGKLTTS